jgi:hypothetical protein
MEAPPYEYPHTTHCYKLSVQVGELLLAAVVTADVEERPVAVLIGFTRRSFG